MAEKRTTKTRTSANANSTKTTTKKKQTTQVSHQQSRFGDSIIDEIILLLIILVSIVAFISLLTDKMGIIGGLFSALCKGLFGFGGLLLPLAVIAYCVWFLVDQERKFPILRAVGAVLFLITVASITHLIHPIEVGTATKGLQKISLFYNQGALSNGGLFGGMIGGALHHALDTLGSVIILLALLVISIVMATGKSLFYMMGSAAEKRKTSQKIRNEKIKSKAEQIRQMEKAEAERAQKYKAKVKRREDFNIELEEESPKKRRKQEQEEAPKVEATVFRKNPPKELHTAKPIFDFVVEAEKEIAEPVATPQTSVVVEPKVTPAVAQEPNADEVIQQIFSEKTEEPTSYVAGSFIVEPLPQDGDLLIDDIENALVEDEEEIPIIMQSVEETDELIVSEELPIDISEEDFEETSEETVKDTDMDMSHEEETEEQEEPLEIPTEPIEEEIPYQFPPITLLGQDPKVGTSGDSKAEMLENARKLESTLKSFGVEAKVIQINKGPTVTRYELSPSQGVKVSKIVNLADDIALNLAASGIRIEAPIPGKAAVGIEVPNKETQSVYLRSVIETKEFEEHPSNVAFALGEDIAGNPVVTDIAKMPHLLIAGATGSGKSVCINTLITSILYKSSPKDVKLLMVDPKVVELSVYNGIPHLMIPVVTDPKKAASALKWAVREMLERYNDFAAHGVRDIKGFNAMMEEKGDEKGKMPQIVIIIDELADLMMAAPGEVEDSICRLAQMARAAGMHLIIATQRPSVDVITGVIKANIPSRLAFAVSSGIDSRTILDMVGAEKLLGKGDMLFYPTGQSKPARLQGAFVTDSEVEAIVAFLKKTGRPSYTQDTIDKITSVAQMDGAGGGNADEDEFFQEALELVISKEKASVSMLQRQFRIGYNRAARLMDDLEKRGYVGPEEGSKPRKVLITPDEWEQMNAAVDEEI